MNPVTHFCAALAAALALGACATPTATSRADPFEPLNRVAYAIHEPLDDAIVRPLIKVWADAVPPLIRRPLANFYNNIEDLFSGINGMLQGKLDKAGHDFGRVLVNTSFGLGGLLDFASDAGIPRGDEDFGQTFGAWGIPQGPYLFIPVFGPTTVRDGTGVLIRIAVGPVGYISDVPLRNVLYGIGYVEVRAQFLEAQTLVDRAALDPYTFVRRSYLQRREYLTFDGNPPRKDDDE